MSVFLRQRLYQGGLTWHRSCYHNKEGGQRLLLNGGAAARGSLTVLQRPLFSFRSFKTRSVTNASSATFSKNKNHTSTRPRRVLPHFDGNTSRSSFSPSFHTSRKRWFADVSQQQAKTIDRTATNKVTTKTSNSSSLTATKSSKTTTGSAASMSEREVQMRIFRTLMQHVWPAVKSDDDAETKLAAKRRKQRVVASVGLMLAGKTVTIQVPYLFKHLVDTFEVASAADLTVATAAATVPISLVMAYGMARAAAAGFQEWRNAVFAHVAQDTIRHVGRSVFDHVHQKLDLQFHLSRNTGQLSRILDRGQRSISFLLNAAVFHVGPTMLEVTLVAGLVTSQFGWLHGAVVLGTVTTYTAFTVAVTTWRTKFRRDMNRLENQAAGRVVDSLLNYETVQYFNNAQHEGERYEQSLKGYQKAALEAQSSLSWLNFGQTAIFSAGISAVMGLTATQIVQGTATVGDLVLVNGLLFQLSVPLFFIGSVYRETKQAVIDMENMLELTAAKPVSLQDDSPTAIAYNPNTMSQTIRLENVHFGYPQQDRSILNGTTFTIPQGKTVAIVGTSGCGKSTIVRLLYRFYDPLGGDIYIGDHKIKDLQRESIQKAIAVIPQDTVLFHDTIAYNLQYGNLNATWDEVVNAAQQAQLHDTILSFPDGYNTVVGERGLKLSGGEKQRVAIARAILKKNAPILLCDEPTSSLDTETEWEIMENLKQTVAGKGRTTLIIAHRLSTIQDCDIIIVLDQGVVIQQGTHEELLQDTTGRYVQMLQMQRQQQQEVEETKDGSAAIGTVNGVVAGVEKKVDIL